ncbi:MAG TPA: translation initiation factor IF-2 [Gammaproteobacteria bacterium]|nr:translation initiation factor IF-2 [Gammaproteobacteria bacterium]
MSTTTVSKLATALKLSSEKLILQLNDAGIDVTDKNDVVSNDQKLLLLNHLRGSHGTKSTASSAPKKLTINRRSQSELKLSGSFGRSRTVNVEVRKKRTYLKKETLIDQAKKELEEQKKLEQEKQKQIEEEIQNQKLESAPAEIINKNQSKISVTDKKPKDTSHKKDKGLKKKKRKNQVDEDPYLIKELHVKGKVKKRKKRKIRRSLSSAILDQAHTFEKPTSPVVKEVVIPEVITPQGLAQKLSMKVNEVITSMMNLGVIATANDNLDQETAILIVQEMGHKAVPMDERTVEDTLFDDGDDTYEKVDRPPVVTIMGHVDHGKTSLLDYIRKSKVVDKEAGGITQHIGAYSIVHKSNSITFLDTPGHAAFSSMRARGANVTDIIILVVAANDGVKPQTVESIEHARASVVPIIVAINKIDKPESDIEKVRNEMIANEIVPDDLGGDCLFVNISAKTGDGIENLLETIVLQSEILDLKASNEGRAVGVVIESGIESGKGAVATILITEGRLNKGDLIIAGEEFGKARILMDENNKELNFVTPSTPVKVFGLSSTPNAGDEIRVVSNEKQGKEISTLRKDRNRVNKLNDQKIIKMKNFMEQSMDSSKKTISLIVKADVQGSVEAIRDSLLKLSTDEVEVDIISSGVGGISESDINLATASNAFIIGFNVRADTGARKIIKESDVEIKYYSVIYETIDDVSDIIEGHATPIIKEEITGLAEVRDIFDSPKLGKIAGCLVTEGTVTKSSSIRVLRDNTVIYEGELESLKRFKDSVNKVKSGTECGIGVKNYNDVKIGDQIECYTKLEINQ